MRSPYDRALALCPTDAAKLELARIGAELQLGADSQEWVVMVLYAEARRLFGSNTLTGADREIAQLEALASRLERSTAAKSVAIAQTHFRSTRVATILTTPAGLAAWDLLEANGADLPRNLARCTKLEIHGRAAQDCILWSSGRGPAPTSSVFWTIQAALATSPSRPFAIIAVSVLGLAIVFIMTRIGPRMRRL